MKTLLIRGSFDPITIQDIDCIKKYHRQGYSIYIEQTIDSKRACDILKHSLKNYSYVKKHGLNQYDLTINVDDMKIDINIFSKLTKASLRLAFIKGYYYDEVIKGTMSNKRYIHSLAVAKCARSLGECYHLDTQVCYMMGLVHDISKELEQAKEMDIMKAYYGDKLNEPRALYHQYTSVYFIRKYLRIVDKRIVQACLNHTSGNAYDQYSMILYIADKVEPNRKYDADYLYDYAKKNLKRAFIEVKNESMKYIKKGELNG